MIRDRIKKNAENTGETRISRFIKSSFQDPNKLSILKGLFYQCDKCDSQIYIDDLVSNLYVCPKCNKYFRISPRERLKIILDENSFIELFKEMEICDPLEYLGYKEKVEQAKEKTKEEEAVTVGTGTIEGNAVAIGVMNSNFLMGSMGKVVGEKITRLIELATLKKIPLLLFTCSGGARMQEGIISLMQMEKTAMALKRHDEAGLLYISVLTDPTTGGVTASFAMLGDVILAEPGALVGFAGPRVIEQTIGKKLPDNFQKSEFVLEHGFIDSIVTRKNMKSILAEFIKSSKNNID